MTASVATAPPPDDPARAARFAGLIYVSDLSPGIRRRRAGTKFRYMDPGGRRLTDAGTLARIRSLAIPPAWKQVWICPSADGHIQATGRDARGRKQYRYHPDWRRVRDETKYSRMLAFGAALPAIRERVAADLRRHGVPREKVLATVVRLLETTLVRVGNDEYAKQNGTVGLTTMRDKHVEVDGSTLEFRFRGKGGKPHRVRLVDRRLAAAVRKCREIPGQVLFQYLDEDGRRQSIGSADVNAYLREVSGEDFTAKDFRTWAGTVLASIALQELEASGSKLPAKSRVLRAVEAVSARLGNTPAVCRKCYIHPAVIGMYLDGSMLQVLRQRAADGLDGDLGALDADEVAVMRLLRARLEDERPGPG